MAGAAIFPTIGTPQADRGNNPLGGAQDRSVFTQPPGGPSPSSFLDRINYQGLEQFGQAADNVIKKEVIDPKVAAAAQDGAQAVSRDPATGQLSVTYQPPIFAWNKAYNDAASKSYVAQAQGDIRQNAFTLAQQSPEDPQAFQSAYKAFADGYIAKAPAQVRGDLTDAAAQLGSQFSEGIVQNKAKADVADARTALQTSKSEYENQAYALARQGGEGTPDMAAAVAQVHATTDQMVANPLFGYSKADQDRDLAELDGGMKAQAIIGHAIKAGHAEGEQSGLDLLNTAIWDPKLNLTAAQRSAYESQGRAQIREDGAAGRAARTEAQQSVLYQLDDASAAAELTGDYTKVVKPNDVVAAFGQYRGGQILEGLNAKVAIYTMRRGVATATPQQLSQMAATLDPGKSTPPTVPTGFDAAWGFTLQHEGGYSAHDANGAAVNFGINQAAHPGVDVSKLTPDTAKPIAKSGYWDAIGGDTLAPNMQAAAFDTAYIFGPEAAKPMIAAAGGDPQKLIEMRSQHMQQLVASDPAKYGRFDHAWEQRNNDLSAFVSGAGQSGGFGAKLQEYKAFVQAVGERQKALAHDPAAYVASVQPTAAQQLSSNDPGTFQNGVRSLIQVQRDMGVAQPAILSKTQAASIVQQFDNPADPTKRADGMNQILGTLGQQYGQYFPQAMKELQKAGLPPEANSLYQVQGQGGVAYRMATAINSMSNMGKPDINANRDAYFANAPNNAEIRKAIPADSVLGDYVESFRGNPDGPPQVEATQNAVSLYARQLSYERGQSGDPTAITAAATKDLIASRYNFQDGYRVPKGIDDAMIKLGANAVRALLPAEQLEPHGLPVPGVDTATRQKTSQAILRTRGIWVTTSDDKGLALVWPAETGYTPVITSDGRPLAFSWAQLSAAGKNPNAINATTDQQDRAYLATGGH